tara:strand:- start:1 stop:336 length:336 start_codon:yes stop_codon:yes gene_type:complete
MEFGARIQGLFENLGSGDWYVGKNIGMQPGQANAILAAGGPAATALAFLLRSKGTPEAEIAAASQPIYIVDKPSTADLQDWARKQGYKRKQDLTPLYIGLGVLAVILVMKK